MCVAYHVTKGIGVGKMAEPVVNTGAKTQFLHLRKVCVGPCSQHAEEHWGDEAAVVLL